MWLGRNFEEAKTNSAMKQILGLSGNVRTWGVTPSYIFHTCAMTTYLLWGYLPCRKDYKV